jgi:hypothetical protein
MEQLKEGIKQGLRVVVLSILPVIISGLNTQTGEININWRVVAVVGLVALLSFIDKWLHEIGKIYEATDFEKYKKYITGLTRF